MATTYTVEEEPLRRFIEANVPGHSQAEVSVTRHPGGHSCETWSTVVNGEKWILRRPPRGGVQKGASNMSREYRVMTALGDTPVPVPRTIALCEDPDVIGAPFFLMEEVDGVVLRHEFLPDFEGTAERRRALGESLVDTLSAMHAVDWKQVGLEKHGRPATFLERNLDLMKKHWEAVRQRPIEAIERVGAYLESHIPPATEHPTIVHGDYKLDNVMWKRDELATMNAVLDWEVSTIADPLVDLGWLRGFWYDAGSQRGDLTLGPSLEASGGFLSRNEIVERYAEKTGRDTTLLPWFEAFGMWKIAIIMEASYARFLVGKSDDQMFATLDQIVPALGGAAVHALEEAGIF